MMKIKRKGRSTFSISAALWIPFILASFSWIALVYAIMPYKTPEGVTYEMPIECQSDLTEATKDTLVYNQSAYKLAIWNRFMKIAPEGWQLFGVTVTLPGFPPFIVMDESLEKEQYDKTLHHERCHIVAGAWHG